MNYFILFKCLSVFVYCSTTPPIYLPRNSYIADIANTPSNYPGKIRAVAKIYNSQRMNRYGWTENCYGAFIDHRLVLTACSCVSYTDDPRMEITPWYHGNVTEVLPVLERNLNVGMMLFEFHPKKTRIPVTKVLLHPSCDNYYHVDYAILVLKEQHPRAEPIWLSLTANAQLFEKKLKAIAISSTMDDGCTVFNWIEKGIHWRLREDPVKFQPWDVCLEQVCPIHRPPLAPKRPQQQNVSECLNQVKSGSRHCVEWTANPILCKLPAGSPLFCDFDSMSGVWGLMVNGRYSCPPWDGSRSIVNGIGAAVDWIQVVYKEHNVKPVSIDVPNTKPETEWSV